MKYIEEIKVGKHINVLIDYLDDENIIRRLYEEIDKKEYINKTDLINILEEFNLQMERRKVLH